MLQLTFLMVMSPSGQWTRFIYLCMLNINTCQTNARYSTSIPWSDHNLFTGPESVFPETTLQLVLLRAINKLAYSLWDGVLKVWSLQIASPALNTSFKRPDLVKFLKQKDLKTRFCFHWMFIKYELCTRSCIRCVYVTSFWPKSNTQVLSLSIL